MLETKKNNEAKKVAKQIEKTAKKKKKKSVVAFCPTGMTLFDCAAGGGLCRGCPPRR